MFLIRTIYNGYDDTPTTKGIIMKNFKKTLEENYFPIIVGTVVVASATFVVLYAAFLGKQAITYQKTSEELLKIIAEKSPEDLVKFTETLIVGTK